MDTEGRDASAPQSLLVLSDGSHYIGRRFGADSAAVGELVFNTSMTGYPEAVTDPSYAGQILTFAYPLQGNYGTSSDWFESDRPQVRAVVAREVSGFEWHASGGASFPDFLSSSEVPGICGVDTRSIVRRVRESGVMPAAIAPLDASAPRGEQVLALMKNVRSYDYGGINFVEQVSSRKKTEYLPEAAEKRAVLLDCGVKRSIINELLRRNVAVTVLPFNSSPDDIRREEPDGMLVSNGPGDPALLKESIAAIKTLLGRLPFFGICLGHQLLAHALGASTYKLKFGHRGANHAVRNLETGKIFITSQNHGYAVKDLPHGVKPLFENCNDGTNEGLRHSELPVFSCQFHPEGSCGPKDANFLFDDFVKSL
ncbi:MAG: glutamine-hydrolyzing carbamoyl-phosphate synthase small subunit [Candidatus Micrarchaeota archaeon]